MSFRSVFIAVVIAFALIVSAFWCAIGALVVPFITAVSRSYLALCAAVLAMEGLVGAVGFGLHAAAVARQPAPAWFDKILSGAPPMAPLLFPNLAALAGIALWTLRPWTEN